MKIEPRKITEMPKFRKTYGLSWRLIKNEGMTSIWEAKTLTGKTLFEITLAKLSKDGFIRLPSNSQWGVNAYTTTTMEGAERRFKQLREKELNRKKK